MKAFGKLVLSALASVLLVACGDDAGGASEQESITEVATLEDALACLPSRQGDSILVTEENRVYVCNGKKWTSGNDDGKSSKGEGGKVSSEAGSAGGESSEEGVSGSSEGGGNSDGGSEEGAGESYEGDGGSSSGSSSSGSGEEGTVCGATPYDTTTHLCDVRDSSIYGKVRIGEQVWMAENLNYDYKIDGVSHGNWCYNAEPDSCAKYGRLYTWAAAMDSARTGCGYYEECTRPVPIQGVCPGGWHLPDVSEWNSLLSAATDDYPDTAAVALKAAEGWAYGGNGSNGSGFSALPSGRRNADESFSDAGNITWFWSSSENDLSDAGVARMNFSAASVLVANLGKIYAFSVRCVKDAG